MNYWGQENFEGLKRISDALHSDSRLKHLASYCDLREKGLRKQALGELNSFLEYVNTLNDNIKRDIVLFILELHWKEKEAGQFIPHPLQKQFILPVLNEWHSHAPNDYLPVHHLGLLTNDQMLLEETLRLNAADMAVRVALCKIYLDRVYYATHHMDEGHIIGTVDDALSDLADTFLLLKDAQDSDHVRNLKDQHEYYASMLSAWIEYNKAPIGTFPDWCKINNHKYSWGQKYYYEK